MTISVSKPFFLAPEPSDSAGCLKELHTHSLSLSLFGHGSLQAHQGDRAAQTGKPPGRGESKSHVVRATGRTRRKEMSLSWADASVLEGIESIEKS